MEKLIKMESFVNIGGISKNEVNIDFSFNFNRKLSKMIEYEKNIDKIWEEKSKVNSLLYNGRKFRLNHWNILENDNENKKKILLAIGLTDYKSHIGINQNNNININYLMKISMEQYNIKNSFFSCKIGVSSILVTKDNFMIFIKRSHHVGEFENFYDVPGGHPEPNNITSKQNSKDNVTPSNVEYTNDEILDEIFLSILNEIHEEINIPKKYLSYPILVGLLFQDEMFTPNLSFYIQTSLTASQVNEYYNMGAKDSYESTSLIMLEKENLTLDNSIFKEITPSAYCCIKLWKEILDLPSKYNLRQEYVDKEKEK